MWSWTASVSEGTGGTPSSPPPPSFQMLTAPLTSAVWSLLLSRCTFRRRVVWEGVQRSPAVLGTVCRHEGGALWWGTVE
jgi:hypothetical protein